MLHKNRRTYLESPEPVDSTYKKIYKHVGVLTEEDKNNLTAFFKSTTITLYKDSGGVIYWE